MSHDRARAGASARPETALRKTTSRPSAVEGETARLLNLQTFIGNAAVQRVVAGATRPAHGPRPIPAIHRPIQRALDDSTDKTFQRQQLSALWTTMKNRSQGKDDIPNYGNVSATLEATYLNTKTTERALAEQIVNDDAYKAYFLDPRLRQLHDDVAFEAEEADSAEKRRDKAILKILKTCLFYHVTFEKYVAAIMAGGLKANKGGSSEGVSAHGRDDAEATEAYKKWSRGHIFITKLKSEAAGYKTKMEEDGETAKIIHVFSNPHFTRTEMKVDIDSKAGLKYAGDFRAVGDGTNLHRDVYSMVRPALYVLSTDEARPLAERNALKAAGTADIDHVYQGEQW